MVIVVSSAGVEPSADESEMRSSEDIFVGEGKDTVLDECHR